MNTFHTLIQEICKEEGITCSILSKDWIVMLEKNGMTKFISGYKFDLNGHGIGNVWDDKYATYEVLKQKQIPVIFHQILFRNTNSCDYAKGSCDEDIAHEFFLKYGKNIVMKANDGTCGSDVYHVTTMEEVSTYLHTLLAKHFSISLCPYYDIKAEYRLIFLNHACVFLYGKKKPIVIGDGKKSIRELLCEFNPTYFQPILTDAKYDKILNDGEVFEYNWQFNLSKGAIPFEIEDESLKNQLLAFGNTLCHTIDLNFCSVDVIELATGEFLIMEINSGVMMKHCIELLPHGKETAKRIYKQAILAMFEGEVS